MSVFVLDASIVLAWCFPDEANDACWKLLERAGEAGAIVPSHWAVEVANAFLIGERRGRINPAELIDFFPSLDAVPIEMDTLTHARAGNETLRIAREFTLTAYDAAYVELARRKGVPLATRDRQLAQAARAAGVETIVPD